MRFTSRRTGRSAGLQACHRGAALKGCATFRTYVLLVLANLDVPVRDAVAVVLQGDVALARAGVLRKVLELARPHLFLPSAAPQFVLDHLHAVQPVLHVTAARDDPRLVPRADGLRRVA